MTLSSYVGNLTFCEKHKFWDLHHLNKYLNISKKCQLSLREKLAIEIKMNFSIRDQNFSANAVTEIIFFYEN